MTSVEVHVLTAVSSPAGTRTETSVDRCACGHLHQVHDVIAARYCAATQASALTRGCICGASHAVRSP